MDANPSLLTPKSPKPKLSVAAIPRCGTKADVILHVLRTADRPIRALDLAEVVYADRVPPHSAVAMIWDTVKHMKRAGIPIRGTKGRSGGYVLEKVAA